MNIQIDEFDINKPLNLSGVRKVLSSTKITDEQKLQFLRKNKVEIKSMVETAITGSEFKSLMKNRPLIKFRPLKNSFTKAGDKKILAKTLNIKPTMVDAYIQDAIVSMKSVEGVGKYSIDELEAIKTYVYRHGTKQQLIDTLDYDLSHVKDILTFLYKTLEYHSGGVADYFMRPIHRMDNNTMFLIYKTMDKHLKKCEQSGIIDSERNREISEWALAKIYKIQNNQKLRNAVKLYKQIH